MDEHRGRQPLFLERDKAERVALSISEQLRNPIILDRAIASSSTQSRYFAWSQHSLASGLAGLSLLWSHLDRCYPNEGWGECAFKCLSSAVKDAEAQRSSNASLFGGLSGLAFAAQYAANGTSRYGSLLNKLDGYILELIEPLTKLFSGASSPFGAPVEVFDLISGLSGTAAYLLTRYQTSRQIDQAVESIMKCFIRLVEERDGIPHWHTPKAFANPHDTMSQAFPNGYLNCGLAHGIPGPLSAMALAKIAGVDIIGLEPAIASIASWLLGHRHDDRWGMNWPGGVEIVPEGNSIRIGQAEKTGPVHSAWCYGSPGLARSIYLSGRALGRSDLC